MQLACLWFMRTLSTPVQGLPNKSFGSVYPEEIRWMPYPALGKDAQSAMLVGEPTMPAPYVIRVRVGAGMKLMPHTHPEDRVYTVISGVFYIGLGEEFDPTKLVAYPPGSVVVLPGDTAHFHWAQSGEYVTQVYGMGPFGTVYVEPADDPRNKK